MTPEMRRLLTGEPVDSGSSDTYDPNADPYLDNRLRSDKPISFLGFVDELRKLWKEAGRGADIVRYMTFDNEAVYPVITYRTLRRLVNQAFKDHKPRYRTTIRHPYIPDTYVELRGQIFDVYVEFNVYSLSQEEADEIAEDLDDFIQTYKGFFKKNGVQEITFFAQDEDKVITDYRFPIACRTIQYTMRFEKVTPIFLDQIDQIAIQAKVVQPPQER